MRIEDQLLAKARLIAEQGCHERFNVGPISDEVWKALARREDIQNLCFRAIHGRDEDEKENACIDLSLVVAGALIYRQQQPTKRQTRKAHRKPSAQSRYEDILSHVALCALDQFADEVGFERNGKKMWWQDFDLSMHADDIFTSDLDWEPTLEAWNKRGIGKRIPSVEAFKKTCERAVKGMDKQGKPIPLDPYIRRVVFPAQDEPGRKRDREQRQHDSAALINFMDLAKAISGLDHFSPDQWDRAAATYNTLEGTSFSGEAFRRKYQRAKRLCAGYDHKKALADSLGRTIRRRSRTHEEYLRNLEEFGNMFRQGARRATDKLLQSGPWQERPTLMNSSDA